eukprot:8839556-Alexandrium_andersonii.AAC.1
MTAASPAPATLMTAPRPTWRNQTSSLKRNTPRRAFAATSVFSGSSPARLGSSACAATSSMPSPS